MSVMTVGVLSAYKCGVCRDIGEDLITFYDQFIQKTRTLKIVHLLSLATLIRLIGDIPERPSLSEVRVG